MIGVAVSSGERDSKFKFTLSPHGVDVIPVTLFTCGKRSSSVRKSSPSTPVTGAKLSITSCWSRVVPSPVRASAAFCEYITITAISRKLAAVNCAPTSSVEAKRGPSRTRPIRSASIGRAPDRTNAG